MPHEEISVFIEAPPEIVFDFVSDLKRIPEYVDFVQEISDITPGRTRVGTTYMERAKMGPGEQKQQWSCIEFNRPKSQAYEGKSSQMHIVLHKQILPEGNGTRYKQWVDFNMFPTFRLFGRLLDPFVARTMRKQFPKITGGIKQIIEREFKSGRM